MSNWRYGALVPTRQFRGAMALPRELKLFSTEDGIFASAAPVPEISAIWKESQSIGPFSLGAGDARTIDVSSAKAFRLSFNLSSQDDSETVMHLANEAGEKVSVRFGRDKVSIDRSESGLMTGHRHFADVVVAAPLSLCERKDGYDVDIYVDVASIELFVDGGRVAMTDIVFPNLPYSQFSIGCLNGEALMGNLKLYELK
jgi:fructan beta-fructosidase